MQRFIEYIEKLGAMVDEDPQLLYSDELQQELKDDFKVFMYFAWKTAFGFTPHKIQYHFADLMQDFSIDNLILCAMREFGKTITDATFIDWMSFRDPNHTALAVSAAQPRAMEITGMALNLIKATPFMSKMVPGVDDLDGRMAFTVGNRTLVRKEASCVATSITSGNAGAHADLILSDDIEIPKNSDTQEKRQTIIKAVDEYTYILNRGGYERVIGTPQTNESVYWWMKDTGNYTLYRIPSEYPDPYDENAMRDLAPFLLEDLRKNPDLAGKPTYPERFSEEDLAKAKAKSPSTYALQMLLDPSVSDENKYPLKLRDFIVMDISPDWGPKRVMWGNTQSINDIPSVGMGKDMFYSPAFVDWTPADYETCVMGIDAAGNGPDEVGYHVAKILMGKVFSTDSGGIQGSWDEGTLKKLCKVMIENNVKQVRMQKTAIDQSYSGHLQRVMGQMGLKIGIEFVPAVGQKEVRIIDTLEPILASHLWVISPRVARDQELMSQLTRLTRERGALIHDDRVDAAQICLSAFTEDFLVDPDRLIEDREDQEFQDEIKSYLTPTNTKRKGRSIVGTSGRRKGRGFGSRYIW